ncbi:protein adenylyltransferase SelO [Wenxinia saemankumensis]|uniref:Protein nucleotidyltransferase YdiU n=1 Tax=Wenxinia saemankumensis TaxID=1447782 RepID=A0A1M6A8W8_9RHOB|nr:YdiU family protein [Wenxinia saemankumensis]SHI32897.1 Uncharacterized conserved protein YdiU, UPF0061 family [Wenxinia saemankumensis]
MSLQIAFDNSYARLPDRLFTRHGATPVAAPRLIALNEGLARRMGLDPASLRGAEGVAMLAGNAAPEGAAPLAQAYAGHQFGNWNPGLGDGRALLLGEIVGPDGVRRDLQLKGSGRTPYSRGGDGRAWLGPVLREYLTSEAMAAMGVPTTRALAAVATGETVLREAPLPGAILARVAASHVRVGTFERFAAAGDVAALEALRDHVLARHYPEADGTEGLLAAVVEAQARLVAQWMALGFVHGVMNTDNMAISGETIDYGPCAFIDAYRPDAVYSSIDVHGRYAWNAQPQIALWNLAQLASSLVPLMDSEEAAIERFTAILDGFAGTYQAEWLRLFAAKLGLPADRADRELVENLLGLMAAGGSDFTNTFAALEDDLAGTRGSIAPLRDQVADRAGLEAWLAEWRGRGPEAARMAGANPRIVPRLHLVERVITAAVAGDEAPFHTLLARATDPFADPGADWTTPPAMDERVTRTFCGT